MKEKGEFYEKTIKKLEKIDDFLKKNCLWCDFCQKYYHNYYDLSHIDHCKKSNKGDA